MSAELDTRSKLLNATIGAYAFSVLPLAQTYAIFFAMPLLITVLSIPMLGEHVGIRRGLAVLVGLIGVMIVLRPGQAEMQLGHLLEHLYTVEPKDLCFALLLELLLKKHTKDGIRR